MKSLAFRVTFRPKQPSKQTRTFMRFVSPPFLRRGQRNKAAKQTTADTPQNASIADYLSKEKRNHEAGARTIAGQMQGRMNAAAIGTNSRGQMQQAGNAGSLRERQTENVMPLKHARGAPTFSGQASASWPAVAISIAARCLVGQLPRIGPAGAALRAVGTFVGIFA
jgi:hypothetical protein